MTAGGDFVPMPSFAAKTCRGLSKKNVQAPKMISVELRTPNGTMMRIQGGVWVRIKRHNPFMDVGVNVGDNVGDVVGEQKDYRKGY